MHIFTCNFTRDSMDKNKNLRSKTISGFKWSFLDNVGRLGGQFVIGLILTRLLTPTDFGLVGMLTIFIVIGQSLTNSGFGQALIQKKDANDADFSTVFYFNILASSLIYIIFYFSAPLIAKFYNQPQLIILTKVICLSFLLNAFGLIHITYLEKQLDFKAPSLIGIVSVVFSGIISIIMAYKGFGVWALVTNTVLKSLVTTILLWKISYWKPKLIFSIVSLKSLFSYGSKILVAGLIQSFFQNIYYLIIGRFFTAQNLGYYTRASQFKDLPIITITSVVSKVTFPIFSTIQDNDEKLISGYTKALRLLSMASLPMMVFIFISCKPLIHIFLGAKWLPVVPYLKVMTLYGWIYVIHVMNTQIITVKGRSDYYLHLRIIDKVLVVISIFVTYKYGILAMIYGHMVATILTYFIGSVYLNKLINITLSHQFKNIFPFFISGLMMLLLSNSLTYVISNEIIYFILSVLTGSLIYLGLLWIFKVDELMIAFQYLNKGINRLLLMFKEENGDKENF